MEQTQTLPSPVVSHFSEKDKGYGNNLYRGPLEALPRPEVFNLEAAIEMMYTEGYCIVPNVPNREEVAELKQVIDTSGGPDEQYNVKHWCFNKHLGTEFHKDPRLLKYATLPGVYDVMSAIHAPAARVTGGTFWVTGPGREMGIHVDWMPCTLPEAYASDPNTKIPIFKSTAHIYLNDMVPELGPTTIIPGSHKSGRAPNNEPTWNGITPKAVMVKAGDVMIFRTEVWHGAWKNSAAQDSRRYMMQIFYGHPIMSNGIPPLRYESYWNPECLKALTPAQKKAFGG